MKIAPIIHPAMQGLFSGKCKVGSIPAKWHGQIAERIIDILTQLHV
jgi:hypothetical protein